MPGLRYGRVDVATQQGHQGSAPLSLRRQPMHWIIRCREFLAVAVSPLAFANFIHRRHACGDEIGSCKLCCNILRNKGDHGVYYIYIIWLHDLTQQYIYIMSQNSIPTKTQYSIQFVIEIHSPQLTRRPCQIIGWKYFNKHIFSKQKRTMVRCLKSSPTKKNNVRLPGRK